MKRYLKKYYPLFVLPTVAAFVVAFLVPFIMGLYLSFTEFTTVNDSVWVGLKNYTRVFFDSSDFLYSLRFTAIFTFVAVITVNLIAFTLALLLTRGLKGTNIFRTVFFMPNLIGGIVLGYIWRMIINGILVKFGVDITYSAKYGFWGLIILMNWQMIGYMMILYIAAIQNIPRDLLEAAQIDGASNWQALWAIKIPMIMPTVTICTFLTLTNSFKLYDQNLALTGGAPQQQTSMLAMNIHDTFYGRNNFEGVGQAKAVIFFLILAAISTLQMVVSKKAEVDLV